MARHNELCDEVADLAGRDFTPAHMRDNPKIFTGCAVHVGKAKSKAKVKGVPPPDGGGLLTRYLWTQGTDSIHEICVLNTDAVSYQSKNPENCLETSDQERKNNYFHACFKER